VISIQIAGLVWHLFRLAEFECFLSCGSAAPIINRGADQGTNKGLECGISPRCSQEAKCLPRHARLQLRFELFNLFNTPNFTDPTPSTLGPGFGFSTQMLNRGYGGLNALFQIGGPRSVQLAAKIRF